MLCSTDSRVDESTAKLVLLYAGHEIPFDANTGVQIVSRRGSNKMLSYKGARVPIYGDSVTFREEDAAVLVDEQSNQPSMHRHQSRNTVVTRIGYDLFSEVHALLTAGQPADNASIPALDLHIAILRDLIVESGVSLVEIPPIPDGYKFIACLTHDVDHPCVRSHGLDHTVVGFLYRATLASLGNFFRGRISIQSLLGNWAAALKLPFVYMGLAKDFWRGFDDRYLELEKGLRSTFFVIPFKNDAGKTSNGPAPQFRAVRYGAREIADTICKIQAAGGEVGLHGIDAWHDRSKGREELEEIRLLTGVSETGVRMHWLYSDQQSPVALEQAGADYDSTIGYNATIGYRAGTSQAYKPFGTTRLLELPLHIMDTALFFPAYLDLSPRDARLPVSSIVDNAVRFGGCVTVNWHDRSVAPERCWGEFYVDLVDELKRKGAWFATAAETVAWFRKRRSATFGNVGCEPEESVVEAIVDLAEDLPGLQLLVHKPQAASQFAAADAVAS